MSPCVKYLIKKNEICVDLASLELCLGLLNEKWGDVSQLHNIIGRQIPLSKGNRGSCWPNGLPWQDEVCWNIAQLVCFHKHHYPIHHGTRNSCLAHSSCNYNSSPENVSLRFLKVILFLNKRTATIIGDLLTARIFLMTENFKAAWVIFLNSLNY